MRHLEYLERGQGLFQREDTRKLGGVREGHTSQNHILLLSLCLPPSTGLLF